MEFTKDELNNEYWREIIGYDYQYQISNLGRLKRVTSFQNKYNGKISIGSFDLNGYLRTSLTKNGKTIGKKIHRLVAEYFIEGFTEELTINHIDFDKSNNRLNNLELMTCAENIMDYISKVKKLNSSSSEIGVNYHKQTCKWVSRITVNGERLPLGSYNTEEEAKDAIEKYKNGELIPVVGKGKSLLGRRKFSEDEMNFAVELSYKIGVSKASKETGISTTTISTLRKE